MTNSLPGTIWTVNLLGRVRVGPLFHTCFYWIPQMLDWIFDPGSLEANLKL